MRVSAAVLALAGSAAANGLWARQASTIISVINSIADELKSFDVVIQGYAGGSAEELTTSSKKVGKITSDAISTVSAASPVTLTDAVSIQGAVQGLQTNLEAAMSDLIGKKAMLVEAGEGANVAAELDSQYQGAQALQKAITSKVPPETQALATQLSAGVNDALQAAIDEYADVAGSGGASSGGASSGGASSGASSGSASTGSSSSAGAAGAAGASSGSDEMSMGGMESETSTTGGSTTGTGSTPAMYTGAASANKAPIFAAVVLGAVALSL